MLTGILSDDNVAALKRTRQLTRSRKDAVATLSPKSSEAIIYLKDYLIIFDTVTDFFVSNSQFPLLFPLSDGVYCYFPIRLLPCCLLYTSPSPRDRTRSRMPSSA